MPARRPASSVARTLGVTVLVVAALITVGMALAIVLAIDPVDPGSAAPRAQAEQPPAPPTRTLPARRVEPVATVSPRPACDTVARGIEPRSISITGVTRGAWVLTPPRDAQGIPGVPPLTEAGKLEFAWDREQGIRPGDRRGNVLLNAHAWPDGSALGNRMLRALHRGDRIVVDGAGARLCYRVTERVEVLAERGLPRYYTEDGPPQLAILTCSGRRLAPGVWEKRTVWFAAPSRR